MKCLRTALLATGLPMLAALSACDGTSGGEGPGQVGGAPAPTPTPTPTPSATATPPPSSGLELTGDIMPAHDPAIIRDGNTWFLFTTGSQNDREGMLAMRTSSDLTAWTWHGPAYRTLPDWARQSLPDATGIWAPDIVRRGGEYRLYYSISNAFGRNRSAIGLTVNNALNSNSPASGWTDRGPVVQSVETDNFNAIDPAVFTDADGREWMAFGSFWSGIKMVELDPATGLRLNGADTIHSLASRPFPGAVEAPFVVRRDGFYYLFVSFDTCCDGVNSTYNTVVGRSRTVTGPYVARDGRAMMEGGGTPVLPNAQGTGARFVGRGHVAVLQDTGGDHIVYHAYDRERNGAPTLRVQRLNWDTDGWPTTE